MKRLIILGATMLIGTAALAETLKVEAITAFTSANPPASVQVRSLGEIQLTKTVKINAGDVLTGCLTDIKDPKRLKRNATFKYQIKAVTDKNGMTHRIDENNVAKFVPAKKLDKKEVAKSAALSVGNHFVQGISAGYRAVEGAVGEEAEGHRLTSAVENVYEHSFLSYASKGQEVVINSGDIFGLRLNSEKEIEEYNAKNAPNYTYEVPLAQ